MEQSSSKVQPEETSLKRLTDHVGISRATSHPICICAPSAMRFPRRVPDPNRGVERKAFEKLLCLVGHDPYAHPFERRRWD